MEIKLTPSIFDLGRKQILGPKKFKSEKKLPENFSVENFWSKKILGPKSNFGQICFYLL